MRSTVRCCRKAALAAAPPPQLLLLALLALPALGAPQGGALAADPFIVGGVHVDESGATAGEARTAAQRAGVREAFSRLLHRVLLERDVGRVPAGLRADPSPLVAGFSVHGERMSSSRYRARMEVRFDAAAVRDLLGGLGVAFEERRPPPQLAVPVLRRSGGAALWDDNPWFDAWVRRAAEIDFSPFVLPHGEAGDVAALTAAAAVAGDRGRIALLGERYGIPHATVAVATPVASARPPAFDLEVRLLRRGRLVEAAAPFRLAAAADESERDLLERAVSAAARVANDLWVASEQARRSPDGSVDVRAEYGGFREWREIHAIVSGTERVASLAVRRLALGRADLRLHHRGPPEALRRALEEDGLEVSAAGGRWTLRLPAPAPAAAEGSAPEGAPEGAPAGGAGPGEPERPALPVVD